MSQSPLRMLDPSHEPTPGSVSQWIGPRNYQRWTEITQFIESNYPDVFETTWLFGGKRFGWSLRYKKPKSFCHLIPEHNRFKMLLVFGGKERNSVETLLPDLVSHIRDDYAAAKTFHDGKWVTSVVDSKQVVADIEKLLLVKRRPSRSQSPKG
jgi:hypothetical protein